MGQGQSDDKQSHASLAEAKTQPARSDPIATPAVKPPDVRPSGLSPPAASPPSSLTARVRGLFEPPGPGTVDTNEIKKPATPPIPSSSLPPPPPTPQPTETVPVTFKWKHGGSKVFLTGSFNNWQGKIMMHRNEENGKHFVLVLDMPPGVHQYKYIVDEAWRLDPDVPTCVHDGFVNNMVEVRRPVFEDMRAEAAAALFDSDDDLDENKQPVSYGQKVPAPDDYVKDPLRLPPHLAQVLLNSPAPSVDPFVLPLPRSHVTLNHLYVYGEPDPSVVVTGITQRFKLKSFASLTPKFVTTIFYKAVDTP